jgi:hypothetical protein
MDRKCSAIESRWCARRRLDDPSFVIDEHQLGYADVTEMQALRVHPEPVRELGIADCDVAGTAEIVPVAGEQAVARA